MMAKRLSSSSSIFEKQGNPWLTRREADKDFPLNRTMYAEAEKQAFHQSIREDNLHRKNDNLRRKMGLKTGSLAKPRVQTIYVDPDMDQFTLASKAKVKEEYRPDKPKNSLAKIEHLRRQANINLSVLQRSAKTSVRESAEHRPENIEVPVHNSSGWLFRGKNKRTSK